MEGEDGVYKEEIGEGFEEVKRGSRKNERGKGWIVGGDFNARTGEGGALVDGEEGKRRISKDKGINGQGAELVKWVEGKG